MGSTEIAMLKQLASLALLLAVVTCKPVENEVKRLRISLGDSSKELGISRSDVLGQETEQLNVQIEGLGELSLALNLNDEGVLELGWDWRWIVCGVCKSGFFVLQKELEGGLELTKDALKTAVERQCNEKLGRVGGGLCGWMADAVVDVVFEMILEDKRIDPLKCCQKLGACKLRTNPFGAANATVAVKSPWEIRAD
ncbi:unnamed protein product [Bursaphelenchus xylophilus]|uniref:(pine wood nematode) hypothetical protein n=1 Tax=Bursaphelenchus xylophilus TaxID=6326 RepID=A0A1I7RJD4_BURXY|nr:unnamed protein product [Bursaphelenchus xylophilus]CAG9128805.1 unnamed protein product [Bursaphelenchus xylophilus]